MSLDYKYYPDKKSSIILAPFSGGQPKGGVELGPDYIVKAGFEDQIKKLGWDTKVVTPLDGTDYESQKNDDKDKFGVKNTKIVNQCNEKIFSAVLGSLKQGRLPITIGGDHSIGTGTLLGALTHNPETCILWIDAHADINTPMTTDSGNLHGCPVSFLLGLDKTSYPPEFDWIPHGILKAGKIAYIGLRDVDDGEKKILRDNHIAAFSMYHIDKYGIGKVIEMALDRVNPQRNHPIHVSYDVDAIDPSFVPATGTRVEGGLTLREGLFIAEEIAMTSLLSSIDIVETNPSLAENHEHILDTVGAACAIGRCAMGQTLL